MAYIFILLAVIGIGGYYFMTTYNAAKNAKDAEQHRDTLADEVVRKTKVIVNEKDSTFISKLEENQIISINYFNEIVNSLQEKSRGQNKESNHLQLEGVFNRFKSTSSLVEEKQIAEKFMEVGYELMEKDENFTFETYQKENRKLALYQLQISKLYHFYYVNKNLVRAESYLNELIQQYPNDIHINYNLATIYMMKEQYETAISYFTVGINSKEPIRSVVRLEQPENSYFNRAKCYSRIADIENAEKDYEEAYKINKKESSYYNNLFVLYSDHGLTEKASTSLEKAVSVKKPSVKSLYNKGSEELKNGNIEDGIKYLRQSLSLDPNYASSWKQLGYAYYHNQNYEMAKKSILSAIKNCPDKFEFYIDLAAVNKKLDLYLEALDNLKDAQLLGDNSESAKKKVADLEQLIKTKEK